jgi:uncharacterized protein
MEAITVTKHKPVDDNPFVYSGKALVRLSNAVLLEAFFNRPDMFFNGMELKKDDRFLEAYFTDRWYNIFEIYDRDRGDRKGWYCNVTRPAQIIKGEVSYIDLALDLLVFPDGRCLVLDEDEFAALKLSPETNQAARSALVELQQIFQNPSEFYLLNWFKAQ